MLLKFFLKFFNSEGVFFLNGLDYNSFSLLNITCRGYLASLVNVVFAL